METIITRTGYCPLCERSRSPRGGQLFLSFGSTHGYHVSTADYNGVIGMVPHIFKGKRVGENMIVYISCAMYECGVDKRLHESSTDEFPCWYYYVKEFRREIWTIEQWNALVLYKHDSDYFI